LNASAGQNEYLVKGGGTAMNMIRKALGLLVLAAFLVLMAAPVFAHGGSGQDVAPNINEATIDNDLLTWGVLQDHDTGMQ
jgi:hypothetical protein